MTTIAALVLPALAVWASVEAVRMVPQVVANRRVRRRLVASGLGPRLGVGVGTGTGTGDAVPPVDRPIRRSVFPTFLPRSVRRRLDDRSRRVRDRAVPDRLDRIIRRLRAGATLPTAIVDVGAGDDVLGDLAADLGRGRPLVPSIARWREADPAPNRRLASIALQLTADAGGASAPVLDGVAESLRDRVALDREVAALSSQSRASAVLLVLAPVAFAVLAGTIDRRIPRTLFGTSVGWACLAVGLVLDVLGALWMARLVGRHR